MTDNGTNFTGAGQFKFALVISSNANQTATAAVGAGQPSFDYITSYQVIGGGSGYVTAPAVTVTGGGGAGATAVAHLTGGSVTSITVGNTGNGSYTSAPTVLVAPPPANVSYTTYWSNDNTSNADSEPANAVGVSVTNGLFTVVLGDTAQPNMTANGVDRPPKNAMLNQRVNELGGTLRTSVRQGFARASFALKTL